MMWSVTICLTFLFCCTCNGQIQLVSLKDQIANMTDSNKKLNLVKSDGSSIKSLKGELPVKQYVMMPSQWARQPEQAYNWPDGQVKYYIDSDTYGEGIGHVIGTVFTYITTYAVEWNCPFFLPLKEKPTDNSRGDWLHFTNPDRIRPCVHEPGVRNDGEIKVVLGYDCLNPRDVLHTILHAIGFRDEVTHPKRDLFVRVMWENIQPAFRSMFRIQPMEGNSDVAEYDPTSIMHFHDRAYSVNGQATILPVLPGLKVEPSDRLSHQDVIKIRKIFGHECKKRLIGAVLRTECGRHIKDDGSSWNQDGTHTNYGPCPVPNNEGVDQQSVPDGVVIPGNDVNLDNVADINESAVKPGVVIPGNDVKLPGHELNPAGAGDSDGEVADSDIQGGDDKVAISGNDVQAMNDDGAVSDDSGPSNRNKLSHVASGVNPYNIASDEGIIVGYDVGKSDVQSKKLSLSVASAGMDNHRIASDEAIIVGYDGENKHK